MSENVQSMSQYHKQKPEKYRVELTAERLTLAEGNIQSAMLFGDSQ